MEIHLFQLEILLLKWWFQIRRHKSQNHCVRSCSQNIGSRRSYTIYFKRCFFSYFWYQAMLIQSDKNMSSPNPHPSVCLAKLYDFTNLDFPKVRGFPCLNYLLGEKLVWSRYSLTRSVSKPNVQKKNKKSPKAKLLFAIPSQIRWILSHFRLFTTHLRDSLGETAVAGWVSLWDVGLLRGPSGWSCARWVQVWSPNFYTLLVTTLNVEMELQLFRLTK